MPIAAGRLDRRVEIQEKTATRDSGGDTVDTWATVMTLWAGKRDVRASERYGSAQVIAEIDSVFTFRWWPAFSTVKPDTHRLVDNGRTYDIHGVTEIGRAEGIEITATARGET